MNQCVLHDSHLVRKVAANGSSQFTYQCRRCGQIDYGKTGRGPWVAKPATIDIDALPLWSDDLQAASMQAVRLQAEAQRAERDEAWWAAYHEYMESTAWWTKRRRVLERDRHLCQGCLEDVANHVHHMTYDRLFNELLCDLVSLCPACHQKCHPHKDIMGRELNGHAIAVH